MQVRLPNPKPVAPNKCETLAVIDLGSSKVCCLIARLKPFAPDQESPGRSHLVEVVGFGTQRAQGIKRGVVVEMEEAERAVRGAVDHAERMARVTVDGVIVNLSGGRLKTDALAADVRVHGHIDDMDIGRVLSAAHDHSASIDRAVLHSVPVSFAIDDDNLVTDPRGMAGSRLKVDLSVVSAQVPAVRNVVLLMERCHLAVDGIVATPYASGLAVLVADELELGTVCLDIGAGTTGIGIFDSGDFVHCDQIAIGGHHVTMDLARGLSTSIDAAERIKTLYGSAISTQTDYRDMVSVPPIEDASGQGIPNPVPRSHVSDIIRPRIEEILELARDRLRQSGRWRRHGRRAVVTGGTSQLPGLTELAETILDCPVRIGRPIGVAGLPEIARGPGFATPVGLLTYPQAAREVEFRPSRPLKLTGTDGYFARVSHWLRENF
ncbi:MAG: cell division protein FtsA [Pseudomonadota bacterium]